MGLLFRNWHIKLAAVAVATVLYTGLVFSGSFDERAAEVPVARAGQPSGWFLLTDDLGTVNVRYRISVEVGDVPAAAFVATADLSRYDLQRSGEAQTVPIAVRSLAEGVTILGHAPGEATVVLDQVSEGQVPIEIERGALPAGLTIEEPEITFEGSPIVEVTARGPSSAVDNVVAAVARLGIDPSGIDVNDPVDLVPVDIDGQEVLSVDLEPATVTVRIEVDRVETSKTIPVRPDISGTPAAGFALERVTVEPATVTLEGTPVDLAAIDEVSTEPVDIAGASVTVVADVDLVLAGGVRTRGLDDGQVSVTAAIGPTAATRTLALGVVCQGAGDNPCLPQIGQLSVTVGGSLADVVGLNAAALVALVDVSDLGPGRHVVTVTVALPDGIDLVAISPANVPVVIEPAATPTPAQ